MQKPITHIAIFVGDAIENIIAGKKTVEGRFSHDRHIPYGAIKKSDIILLKQSGGPIIGQAEVENVLYFDNLDGEKIGKLRREYGEEMAMNDLFWSDKQKSRYATIVFLIRARRYLTPLSFHKHDRRAWVVV